MWLITLMVVFVVLGSLPIILPSFTAVPALDQGRLVSRGPAYQVANPVLQINTNAPSIFSEYPAY